MEGDLRGNFFFLVHRIYEARRSVGRKSRELKGWVRRRVSGLVWRIRVEGDE